MSRALTIPFRIAMLAGLMGPLLLRAAPSRADAPVKADSGKFILILQEAEIGTDTFTTLANGETESRTSVNLGGQKVESHNITVVKNGLMTTVFTEAGVHGKMNVKIEGQTVKLTIDDMPTMDQKLDARVYPFGNFVPHLLAYLVAAYDIGKGGPQKFAMILTEGVGPKGIVSLKATISSLGAKLRQVGGKAIPISRYSLVIPGPIGNIDTEIDTDTDGRILLWTVPGQKLNEVRDGYQALTEPEQPADPLLSKPTFSVVTETKSMVPMRDGVKLATDIYRPTVPGRYPVILQRTPYGRNLAPEATSYARRGYVFVVQDVRGRFDSEGDFHPFVLEAKDGYDAIEWCAAQPWSNGKVGMIGGSYLGFVQWAAAREGSPHLKCLIPIVSPPDPFFNVPYEYGVPILASDLWWANVVKDRGSITVESPASTLANLEGFKTLPLAGVDKAILGRTVPFFQEWLKHSTNDDYYTQVNFLERMSSMPQTPALHVSGWFDGDGIGTKLNYAAMVRAGQKNQRLVYGPWGHAVNTTTKIGPFDFGPQSLRDLDTLYLRWFDHWLKDIDNGVDREPPVEAFIMGANEWRKFRSWPPKEAVMQRWYLHSTGHAGGDTSPGSLSATPASSAEPDDTYTYDPADPYIPGGAENFKKAMAAAPGDEVKFGRTEHRQDLLYYTSSALSTELMVAGPISLHLTASTSARDTDWFAMLQDVYPDGRVAGICRGIVRARFHKSLETPTLLTPGEPVEYDIDLWALGNTFKKGHKLQILITSSFFPSFARNLNTGGDIATETTMVSAHQAVHHSSNLKSYLTLPVLPN